VKLNLKDPEKTEPLKGIIDKLNKEEKVPSYIITSMHGLNSLSTYGAHPKDFDPEQVKPALNNLAIIIKWYLRYKGTEMLIEPSSVGEEAITGDGKKITDTTKLEKSIAVLPFINDSPDQENTYFINGVMEEILNNLQKIKDLRVISRTSIEQYRNQHKSISEIAEELDVNYIVEGSGQKYGNTFLLRTQLIKAERETHIWGESYQQKINDVEDIFNIQRHIAESIAEGLRAVVTPQEKKLIEKVPTENLEAYDAYLKGQFYWRKVTSNDFDTAMKYFELAKGKDSDFALAYAGISDVWIGRQQIGAASPDVAGPKAMEAAMKALELDATRAEVYYSLAQMHMWGMFDWNAAEKEFKKAVDLKPNYPEARAYYSQLLTILGREQEARDQIKLALKQDPLNALNISLCATDLVVYRQYEDAINMYDKALEMDPNNFVAINGLMFCNYGLERYSEVIDAFKRLFTSQYNKDIFNDLEKRNISGDFAATLNFMAQSLIDYRQDSYVLPCDIAQLFVMAGNKELTLEWLEKAFEEHDPNLLGLALPVFDSIREEPRFQEIAKKMNLPYK